MWTHLAASFGLCCAGATPPSPWSALLRLIQFCELTLSIWNSARCLTGSQRKATFISGSGFMEMNPHVDLWNEASADESEERPRSLVIFGNKAQKTPQAPLRIPVNHSRTPKSPYEYLWLFEDKKMSLFSKTGIWRFSFDSFGWIQGINSACKLFRPGWFVNGNEVPGTLLFLVNYLDFSWVFSKGLDPW